MNFLTITSLKGLASIQDLGRNSSLHKGFSGSGAVDEFNYLRANELLDNPSSSATLEITLGQFSFVANASCEISITGADCHAEIKTLNNQISPIKPNTVITLLKGDEVTLAMPKHQLHSYIAIKGGFNTQQWLNSYSQTLTESHLGFGEPSLNEGHQLFFHQQVETQSTKQKPFSNYLPCRDNFHQQGLLTLRFLPSELWLKIGKDKQKTLLQQQFTITSESNRMGYRLKGNAIHIDAQEKTLSKPVNYGTIQLPQDGQPIVLMKERQTIGGYPILGTVIKTDLFRLSQKRPGEKIQFTPTTLLFAQAQLLAFKKKFRAKF